MAKSIVIIFAVMTLQSNSVRATQLTHSRVKIAYQEKEKVVKSYFILHDLLYEGFHIFIRGFKKEGELEVWVREKGGKSYLLLHTYPFCSSSGELGPKRKEGDLQIPEGIYHINHFNPKSNFYLSLGINYPNASDRILGDPERPGSAIYIHGNCVTVGCIPITDDKIKELYVLAVEAKNNGQDNIPVHIFPARLSDVELNTLSKQYDSPELVRFWRNLQPVYKQFEDTRQLKRITVSKDGAYVQTK